MLDQILSTLIRNSIDAAILACLVGLALFVLREGIAAKWRFALWGLVIIRLAMPVQPPGLVGLSVVSDAVLQRASVVPAVRSQLTASNGPRLSPTSSSLPVDGDLSDPSVRESPEAIDNAVDDVVPSAGVEAVVASPRTIPPASGDVGVRESTTPFSWTRTILAVWLLGVAFLLTRRLMAGARLRWLLSRLTACTSQELLDEFAICRQQLQIDRPVRLEMSDEVTGPVVTGIFNSRVLCPTYVESELNSPDRRLLLMHELMHVVRRDVLWKELVDLVCLLNWFHPLAWWARRRMEQERELACDAAVLELSIPADRAQYGRMALHLLELQQTHTLSPGLVAWSGPKKHLKRRIEMIARFETPRRWQSAVAILLTVTLASIGLTRAADDVRETSSNVNPPATGEATGNTANVEAAVPVAGTCVDADGVTLARVSLRLLRVDYDQGSSEELQQTISDNDGHFEFTPIAPFVQEQSMSSHVVIAQQEGKATAQQHLNTQTGDVASWQTLGLRLLDPAPVSGQVVDRAGEPVVAADVYLQGWPNAPLSGVFHSRTNENGEFNIADAPPLDTASESSVDGDDATSRIEYWFFHVAHRDFGVKQVAATERPTTVTVVLDPASIVEGRVVYADGTPAADVDVMTQSVQLRCWNQVRTDANGVYRLVLADVDNYNIWASADDLICQAIDSFEVASGETREAPTITLIEGGFVEGRILDADTGKPLESFPEGTSVASYGPHRPHSGAACISTPVDEDGNYRLRVAPGEVFVYLMNRWKFGSVDPADTTVRVAAGQTVTVDFLVQDEENPASTTSAGNQAVSDHMEFLQQRTLAGRERPAIAAITELGGWVETEIIDGNEFVTTLNMVYHEPEGGPRLENNNKLSDEALFYAAKFTHLRMLLLHLTQASDEALAHVAGLSELEKVYIWDGTLVTDVGVAHLAALPSLTYIHLDNSAVTDQSLELLSHLHGLKGISMQGGTFTDQGLEHLAGLTQLESLWIGRGETHIADNGLIHLAGLENLRELDLQGTEITDAGLLHLHGLKNLTNLYVSGTGVTDEGVAAIRRAIPGLDVRP